MLLFGAAIFWFNPRLEALSENTRQDGPRLLKVPSLQITWQACWSCLAIMFNRGRDTLEIDDRRNQGEPL